MMASEIVDEKEPKGFASYMKPGDLAETHDAKGKALIAAESAAQAKVAATEAVQTAEIARDRAKEAMEKAAQAEKIAAQAARLRAPTDD